MNVNNMNVNNKNKNHMIYNGNVFACICFSCNFIYFFNIFYRRSSEKTDENNHIIELNF